MSVIHVRVGFREGLPEVTTRNKLFASIKSSPEHQKLFEGTSGAIHPTLGPEPDDIVVTKHRISAFAGSDLQMILRAKEVDTLVLFGIADCCADSDAELHRVLVERLFPLRAEVTTAAEFVKAVGARG
jgi:nicotinamidase-related amidase